MQKTRGFVVYVVLILVALVALGATQITLPTFKESETEKVQLSAAETALTGYWKSYLEKPVLYIWNNLLTDFIWTSFLDNMQRISNGEPTDFQKWAPVFGDPSTYPTESAPQPAITVHIQKNVYSAQNGNPQ